LLRKSQNGTLIFTNKKRSLFKEHLAISQADEMAWHQGIRTKSAEKYRLNMSICGGIAGTI